MPPTNENLKDARDQLTLVLSFFPRVDAKLSTVLAIDTAMIAAVSASFPPLAKMTAPLAIAPSIVVILLSLSFYNLYRGGFPDVRGGSESVVYFQEIGKRTEAKFTEEYLRQTSESLCRDVLGQVWRNSEILAQKFRCLKSAFIFMAFGVLPWAISIALFALLRANMQFQVVRP